MRRSSAESRAEKASKGNEKRCVEQKLGWVCPVDEGNEIALVPTSESSQKPVMKGSCSCYMKHCGYIESEGAVGQDCGRRGGCLAFRERIAAVMAAGASSVASS